MLNIKTKVIFFIIFFSFATLFSSEKVAIRKIVNDYFKEKTIPEISFYDSHRKEKYLFMNAKLEKTGETQLNQVSSYYLEPTIIFYLIKNKIEKNISQIEINNDFIDGLHIFDSYYMTRWQIEMDLIFKILGTALSENYSECEKYIANFNDLRLYQEFNLNKKEIKKEKKYWTSYSKEGKRFSKFCKNNNISRSELFYHAVQNSEIPEISNNYIKKSMFWISFALEILPRNIKDEIIIFPNPELTPDEKSRIWKAHTFFYFNEKRKLWKEKAKEVKENNPKIKYKFELISSFKPYLDFTFEKGRQLESGAYFFNPKKIYLSNKDFQCLIQEIPLLEITKIGSIYKIAFFSNKYIRFDSETSEAKNILTILSNENPRIILDKNSKTLIYTDDSFSNIPDEFKKITKELNRKLILKGVNSNWLAQQLRSGKFKIYKNMPKYFKKMPENQVQKKKKDLNWYRRYFAINSKINRGKNFISKHKELLETIQKKHGIPYQLIVAILGIETNFAHKKQKGNFYTFNALYSQYLLLPERRRFALNEIINLYKFTKKTETDTFYYIGSFAGACGWGQFIPSSLNSYFIDSNGIDSDIDIYSLEDNLASIENYLYKNGLNGNKLTAKRIYNSVYAYNHSNFYVKSVLEIYEGLKEEK